MLLEQISFLLLFFPSFNLGSTPFLKLSFSGRGVCQRVGGLISKFDSNFYRVFVRVLVKNIKTTHILQYYVLESPQ